jgi:hypothetical protein
MFELLTLFLTGGGSAAMGSILKGVFGSIADSREQKYKLELQRDAANNEHAVEFQKALHGEDGSYVRTTRRMLALILMCTLSAITILSTIYPSVPLVTLTNIAGDAERSFLFGLFTFPAKQAPVAVTTGHIALFQATVVLPMVVGFYFTPGGRR